ncbi:MAG: AAA family ATPase [Thiocapsa sp.]|uniref:AAA family ATPase n=1 Tax=Thiocapsa sp. TaxID=2024551 RepID=UPI001BD03C35|nr:AAA family ATPase [Thiocapsa sp.]QVL50185.1 MAG: AAA family ATPase [Thiocapsa sp.]
MLTNIRIQGFKCLDDVSLQLAPLTLLVGSNSSGKSTVFQAILLNHSVFQQRNGVYLKEVVKPYSLFEDVASRISNPSEVIISIEQDGNERTTVLKRDGLQLRDETHQAAVQQEPRKYEESLYYLAANRIGLQELTELNPELRIGDTGQYALSYLEQHKDKPIHSELVVKEAPARTLKAQLAWWLSFITGISAEARTQKVTSTIVKTSFVMDEIGEVSPNNTGAGNGFLLKVCILCLASKPGDLLIIENPEIHLHPAAQSRLAKLLVHLSAKGVQLLVETHCEHLINRVRYEVYRRTLPAQDLMIYYKQAFDQPFERLHLNPRGHFCDEQGNERPFPSGFFDSTLSELLEMG